jgi:hypothetical protein
VHAKWNVRAYSEPVVAVRVQLLPLWLGKEQLAQFGRNQAVRAHLRVHRLEVHCIARLEPERDATECAQIQALPERIVAVRCAVQLVRHTVGQGRNMPQQASAVEASTGSSTYVRAHAVDARHGVARRQEGQNVTDHDFRYVCELRGRRRLCVLGVKAGRHVRQRC